MIKEIAILLGTSLSFSLGFGFLGYPHLLGYIATGIALGPILIQLHQANLIIHLMGEFGMLMLIFIIGIEFDLMHFKRNWKLAFKIFALQFFFSSLCGIWLQYFMQIPSNLAFLIICLIMLSSTAIVVRLLEEMNELKSEDGSLILSILIFQDLAVVPIMLILKAMGGESFEYIVGFKIILSIVFLTFLINYLGSSKKNMLLKPLRYVFNGNEETMFLGSIAFCFSFAALSEFLGLSHSYGPFIAGMLLGSLCNKKEILSFAKPIGSFLMMMFFIFIGSEIDIIFFTKHLKLIIFLSTVLLLLKIFLNCLVLYLLNFSKKRSFFVALMISQASEFSFSFVAIVFANNVLSIEQKALANILIIISLTLGSILPILGEYLLKEKAR